MMDIDEPIRSQERSLYGVLRSYDSSSSSTARRNLYLTTSAGLDLSSAHITGRKHLKDLDLSTFMADNETDGVSKGNKFPRKEAKSGVRLQLPNTGRMVFAASSSEVSDIYRALGKDLNAEHNDQRPRQDGNDSSTADELLKKKMKHLNLDASTPSSSSGGIVDGKDRKPTGGASKQGKNVPSQKPAANIPGLGNKNKAPIVSNSSAPKPATAPAQPAAALGGAKNPYFGFKSPSAPQQQSGRAAAISRMAAFGAFLYSYLFLLRHSSVPIV